MDTIEEKEDKEENERRREKKTHPLLEERVLSRLMTFLTTSELKTARLVCEFWKSAATPVLMKKSIVNLEGICSICHSPFLKERHPTDAKPVHDHRRTVSFYRFVSLLHILYPRDREKILFRNFRISNINLYFIPRVNTEPTKYFQMFVKLFGDKVYELHLDSVQICPVDSVPKILAMFKNLEILHFENSSLWMDPAEKKAVKAAKPPPPPRRPPVVEEYLPHFSLQRLSFGPNLMTEKYLNWDVIFDMIPGLLELNLRDFTHDEINKCLEVLSQFPEERNKQMIIQKVVIRSRGHTNTPIPVLPPTSPKSITEGDEAIPSSADTSSRQSSTENGPLLLESTNRILSNALRKLSQLRHLELKIEYTAFDSEGLLPVFQECCDKLNSLSLDRPFSVLGPETELYFKRGLFETPTDNPVVFPYVTKLSIAHNFVDSFEEIKQSFPKIDTLCLRIVATEVLLRDRKPYHTYLNTNLVMYMGTAPALPTVSSLTWDIQDARHKKTKFRTIVYKTNALRHLSRVFPHLTKLTVSITTPTDMHLIFRDLPLLEEFTVLKNSLYRTKDTEITGNMNAEDVKGSTESVNEVKSVKSRGIRQLKRLQRLSLENNNCCLTNEAVKRGFVYLTELRSLHINNARKLTLRGLRYLQKCRHLAFVNIVKPKRPGQPDLPDEPEVEPPSPPRERPLMLLPDKYTLKAKTKIPKSINPPRRFITKRITLPHSPSPSLLNVSAKGSLPILISSYTPTVTEVELGLSEVKSFGRLSSPSLLSLPPILPMDAKTGKVDFRTAMMAEEALDVKEILGLNEKEPAKRQLETFIMKKSRSPRYKKPVFESNKIPFSSKKPPGYRLKFQKASKAKTILKNFEPGCGEGGLWGRRYGFVTTYYRVNGRTYQLVRRRYETDSEKEKFYNNYRSWVRKKRAGFLPEKPHESEEEDENQEPVHQSDAEGSESEYERSIKDYDEDEDSDEYVDDEFQKESFRVPVPSGSDSYESSDDEKVEPVYEGDKEFYDDEMPEIESDFSYRYISSSETYIDLVGSKSRRGSKLTTKRLTFAADVPGSAVLYESQQRERSRRDLTTRRISAKTKDKTRSRSKARNGDQARALDIVERKRREFASAQYSSPQVSSMDSMSALVSPPVSSTETIVNLTSPPVSSTETITNIVSPPFEALTPLSPEIRVVSPQSLEPRCQRRSACCVLRSGSTHAHAHGLPPISVRTTPPVSYPSLTTESSLDLQSPPYQATMPTASQMRLPGSRLTSPYSDSDYLEAIHGLYSPPMREMSARRLSPLPGSRQGSLEPRPLHPLPGPGGLPPDGEEDHVEEAYDEDESESASDEEASDAEHGNEFSDGLAGASDEENPTWPSEWPSAASQSHDSDEGSGAENEELEPDPEEGEGHEPTTSESKANLDDDVEAGNGLNKHGP